MSSIRERAARVRDLGRAAAALVVAAVVAACAPGFLPQQAGELSPMGSGPVRVALLLPLSGEGAATGQAMQRTAELALSELNGAAIQLLPLDTRSTPAGAEAAARRAVDADVGLVLGPVFASEVQRVAAVARPAEIPVIAFSSDNRVAGDGVYLLSYPPDADIRRVVEHAVGEGRRAFAALVPDGPYGDLAADTLRRATSDGRVRLVALERYGSESTDPDTAVGRIAEVAGGDNPRVDALFLPDTGERLRAVAAAVARAGVGEAFVRRLGSGQWNEPEVWRIPELAGGRFAAPPPDGWRRFADKYRSRFGAEPPRNATLAYDAVSLAAALARLGGAAGFDAETLTNPDGFSGVDGVFRFRGNGTVERGLAILEIEDGTVVVREPAPRAFGGEG